VNVPYVIIYFFHVGPETSSGLTVFLNVAPQEVGENADTVTIEKNPGF